MLKEYFNCTYIEAVNGLEALRAFEKDHKKTCCSNKFKLVLMDVNMPIMDGYDSTKEIIKFMDDNDRLGTCSIVAVTANSDKETKDKCLSVGMKDVFLKPLGVDKMRVILTKYLCKLVNKPQLK